MRRCSERPDDSRLSFLGAVPGARVAFGIMVTLYRWAYH